MEQAEFIEGLENELQEATMLLIKAIHSNNLVTFQGAVMAWCYAAETWLVAQGMSQEDAQAVMPGQLIVTRGWSALYNLIGRLRPDLLSFPVHVLDEVTGVG